MTFYDLATKAGNRVILGGGNPLACSTGGLLHLLLGHVLVSKTNQPGSFFRDKDSEDRKVRDMGSEFFLSLKTPSCL